MAFSTCVCVCVWCVLPSLFTFNFYFSFSPTGHGFSQSSRWHGVDWPVNNFNACTHFSPIISHFSSTSSRPFSIKLWTLHFHQFVGSLAIAMTMPEFRLNAVRNVLAWDWNVRVCDELNGSWKPKDESSQVSLVSICDARALNSIGMTLHYTSMMFMCDVNAIPFSLRLHLPPLCDRRPYLSGGLAPYTVRLTHPSAMPIRYQVGKLVNFPLHRHRIERTQTMDRLWMAKICYRSSLSSSSSSPPMWLALILVASAHGYFFRSALSNGSA